uniref:ZPT2-10 n=1 Tax=Petunia hybrida TaxID=4102 RepID=O22082_PETHY|nr:ZPT2-10 [Petunia x hybrida]BAA96070.1 C2H2 zinc-finger protein ZPT2-10 [Petunia x hybrida]
MDLLQDRESETESLPYPTQCKRYKRIINSRISDTHYNQFLSLERRRQQQQQQYGKITEFPFVESEPVSSISDTSPDEDVANCLMMLSRDKWMTQENEVIDNSASYDEDVKTEDSVVVKVTTTRRGRGKYICETCNKVFRSYQALGGHRASHKKIKVSINETKNNGNVESEVQKDKIHECPVCYRVFSSGQALGGHKRSHGIGVAATNVSLSTKIVSSRISGTMIDLNIPATLEDDEISQIEVSAVSDDEFVNP